jgi:integrase
MYIQQTAKEREWRASTTLTYLGNVRGAVSRVEVMEVEDWKLVIQKGDEIRIGDYAKILQRKKLEQMVTSKQAKPVTKETVQKLLQTVEGEVRVYLTLMWLCVSRPGCTAQLRPEWVQVSGRNVKVMFIEGKQAKLTGQPHPVHTFASKEQAGWIQEWVNQNKQFSSGIERLALRAVRMTDEELSLRSFRRGAAIHLSIKGASLDTIRKFTGHTTEKSCRIYLSYGWDERPTSEVVKAAKTL